MKESIHQERDRAELRRAAERLLAWGFPPRSIAQQLHCSVSWVYTVRRERALRHAEDEEQPVSSEYLLEKLDQRTG